MNDTASITIIASKRCNNNCRICARSHLHIEEAGLNKIEDQLRSIRAANRTEVILTGGEVTLHKDIFEILELAKSLGFSKISVQTNGRLFADKDFAKRAAAMGDFLDVFLSIHGHTAAIHEEITGVRGSFAETLLGISHLVSLNVPVRTNTVICQPNYQYLEMIADFLIAEGVKNPQFGFIHPTGEALKNEATMIPDIEVAAPFIKKALSRNENGVTVLTEAVPFCLLDNQFIYAAENISISDYAKIKGKECSDCLHYSACPGIWKSYFSLRNFVFRPVK